MYLQNSVVFLELFELLNLIMTEFTEELMHQLEKSHFIEISCGNVAVAAGAGVAIYTGAAALIDSTQTLVEFGQNVGEHLFNLTHPDQLGQMIYTENDFK